jgi:hypothetical protein
MANKGFNLMIDDVKRDIANAINQSGLPISIIEMIVMDIANEISTVSKNTLNRERKEYEDKLEQERLQQEQSSEQ